MELVAPAGSVTNIDAFVLKQLELLKQEKNEEYEQNRILREQLSPKLLQKQGVCLLGLRASERCSSLYGRLVVTFESSSPFKKELASHRLSPGDIVGIYPSQKSWTLPSLASGIVTKCTQTALCIAVDVADDKDATWGDDEQFLLLKLANDVTYKRLKDALNRLRSYTSGSASDLRAVLFGETLPSPAVQLQSTGVSFFNDALDESQKEAVLFALSRKEVAIVHGPPGTGKTTTVVEIMMQAVHRGLKVLACAPSNIAVDGLVERLASGGRLRVVRLGHPARALPAVQRHSLDAVLSASDGARIVEDVRREIDTTLNKLKKTRDQGERRQVQGILRSLRKELRERSDKAVKDILGSAQVVLATLTSATETGPLKILDDQHFDLTIVDECSQATEAACWVALLKCGKCVLAGDHKQLPPTIVSQQAAKAGLSRTLMERLLEEHASREADVVRMLTVQYRMHELIMKWSSEAFYNGRLTAHASVAKHLLRDLSGVQDDENTRVPLLLIDTTGCNLFEVDLPEEVSKANEGEADLVAIHVEQLIKAGVKSEDVAVISPYNLQVELLRSRLSGKYPRLEIKSVDGFQGREKEAVVISCVRSNKKGEVGFLAEDRRLNVAVTRARRHVMVVCDAQTVGHHAFLQQLVEYFEKYGEVRSAHLYTAEGYCIGEDSSQPVLELQRDLEDSAEVAEKARDALSASVVRAPRTAKITKIGKLVTTVTSSKQTVRLADNVAEIISVNKPQDDERRRVLESIITDFLNDKTRQEHAFSNELNSFERRVVHEIAEKLGLGHQSKGEGQERYVVLLKVSMTSGQSSETRQPDRAVSRQITAALSPVVNTASLASSSHGATASHPHSGFTSAPNAATTGSQAHTSSSSALLTTTSLHDKANKSVASSSESSTHYPTKTCAICQAAVPAANYDLHTMGCGRSRRPSAPPTTPGVVNESDASGRAERVNQDVSGMHSSTKSKKCKQKLKAPCGGGQRGSSSAAVTAPEDDFDELLREASRHNASCGFGLSCKTPVLTLGQNCEFCACRFCLAHHMPEVHGCGAAAKARARQLVSREGASYVGSGGSSSGLPSKKPSAQQRSALERKLSKKLDQMSEQRRAKAPPSSGST